MIKTDLTVEQRLELLRIRHSASGVPTMWHPCHRTVDCEHGLPLLWNRIFDDDMKPKEDGEVTSRAMGLAAAGPRLLSLLLELTEETGRFSTHELERIYSVVSYLIPEAGEKWENRSKW